MATLGGREAVERAWAILDRRPGGASLRQARRLMQTAAETGSTDGLLGLAWMKREGLGGPADQRAKIALLERAAQGGSPVAQFILGDELLRGRGVSRKAKGTDWILKSATQGYGPALNRWGRLHYRAGNLRDARVTWQEAAKRGSDAALYNLGILAENHSPRSAKRARQMYQQSARRGYVPGMINFGSMLYLGEGGRSNPQSAVRWWRRAALAGDSRGQFNLGLAYATGRGVRRNEKVARTWLEKAAGASHRGARAYLRKLDAQRRAVGVSRGGATDSPPEPSGGSSACRSGRRHMHHTLRPSDFDAGEPPAGL